MKCQEAEQYMMKYMDGEISKEEADLLHCHLQQCCVCKEAFLVYDNMLQVFETIPLVEAPVGFEEQVMIQITTVAQEELYQTKNRIWGHIWGTFTILFGGGAVLAFYREPILASLANLPYFADWVVRLEPIEKTVTQQGQALQTMTEQAALWTDQILANSAGILLVILAVVCGIQYVLLRRKNSENRMQRK